MPRLAHTRALSPDGRRVAVTRRVQGNTDLWLLDGARMSRFTFDAGVDQIPVWSPDGTRIVFNSNRTGQFDLYQKLTSGAGVEERLVASDQDKAPTSWSADGRFLLYHSVDPQTSDDLWIVPMAGERTPSVFLKTPFRESLGRILAGRSVGGLSCRTNRGGWRSTCGRCRARGVRRRRKSRQPGSGRFDGRRRLPAVAARRQGAVLSRPGGRDDGGDDHGNGATLAPGAPVALFSTPLRRPAMPGPHTTSPATAGS